MRCSLTVMNNLRLFRYYMDIHNCKGVFYLCAAFRIRDFAHGKQRGMKRELSMEFQKIKKIFLDKIIVVLPYL